LIAIDTKTQQVIGSSRFHGYDQQNSEVEIGWTFLARSHWGGSYNGEMKQLMLQHAFRSVNFVVFLIGPQNLRSQRAAEKSVTYLWDQGPTVAARKVKSTKSLLQHSQNSESTVPGRSFLF